MTAKDCRIQSVLDNANLLITASVDTAAGIARLSVSHFRSLFRESTGMTYAAWLKNHRLETALQLLQTTDLTIPEICRRIGFQDTSHFIRSFKRKVGRTPAALRPTNNKSIRVHRRSSAAQSHRFQN